MKKDKSISIRLITLIKVYAIVILAILIGANLPKESMQVATVENNVEVELANGKTLTEDNTIEATREITVSSRSEERPTEQIEETYQEEIEENYISIEEVQISQNMDLTQKTGLSKEDFITLISGVKQDTSGFFEENAGTIYDLCEEYELNEIFFCGLISAESGWNIADNHRRTYNYISLMSNGKLIQFESVEDGLEKAAQKLHNNYLTPGGKFYYGKTLSAVKTKFCPSSSTWISLVYGRMKQILN